VILNPLTAIGYIPFTARRDVGNGRDLLERVVGMESNETCGEECWKGSETDRSGFTESARFDHGVTSRW